MNSSMQRFLAARGKMIHVSRPLVPTPVTYADGTLGSEMLPAPKGSGNTLNTGRNAAKRAKRQQTRGVYAYAKALGFGPAPREYKPGVIGRISN